MKKSRMFLRIIIIIIIQCYTGNTISKKYTAITVDLLVKGKAKR